MRGGAGVVPVRGYSPSSIRILGDAKPTSMSMVSTAEEEPTGPHGPWEPVDPSLAMASGFGDPLAPELPAPQDLEEVIGYLSGPGELLLVFREQIQPLLAHDRQGDQACSELAKALDAASSPEELLAAASAAPDDVTSDLLMNVVSSGWPAMESCTSEDVVPRAELAWQTAVLDRRLQELGLID